MKIIVPIGISGSGKSTLYKGTFSDIKLVCPDLIRYELTGDISDQSCNGRVFKIVDERIEKHVQNNEDVFYDATNVVKKYRKKFVNKFKNNPNVYIVYYILNANIDLSYNRIKNDLRNNINISNVSYKVLEKQMENYKHTLNSGFDDENVHEIIYYNE